MKALGYTELVLNLQIRTFVCEALPRRCETRLDGVLALHSLEEPLNPDSHLQSKMIVLDPSEQIQIRNVENAGPPKKGLEHQTQQT